MEILSHRGIGFGEPENSVIGFKKALTSGFGLEIDVRQGATGEVVISHDEPLNSAVSLNEVADFLTQSTITIAVHLKQQTEKVWRPVCEIFVNRPNMFLFDPTIETARAIKSAFPNIKLAFSVGESHFSPTIYLLEEVLNLPECDYIWWDEWVTVGSVYNISQLEKIRAAGKRLYVISPELHKYTNPPHEQAQNPQQCWKELLKFGVDGICTDFPLELENNIKLIK